MNTKLLLIGWDAADWKVINELMADGKMPTLQGMVERGTMGNLRTLTPPLSPMLWTSIATGKRPFKHGIYGFTEPTPKGDAVQPMTNVSRSSKAIWNILNQHDQRSVVVGWWPSHPAEPIRGAMVSDFFHKAPKKPGDPWPLRKNSVHPPEKLAEIADLRVHPLELTAEDILPFVPEGADIDQTTDGRVAAVMKVTAECTSVHAAATHLLESESWDFAAVYYDAIDHYSHGFMKHRAPQQEHVSDYDFKMYRHVVDMGYIFHDMMLKQLLEFTDEDTTVMLISDHGFHPDHLRPMNIPNEPAGPAKEHRDYGIFVATGPTIKPRHTVQGANLLDITPTILTCYGLPIGEDMDGRVLEDIFIQKPEIETIKSWESIKGDTGEHPPGFTISAEESKAALDQLVALGYIDPVEDDSKIAVANCVRELEFNLSRAYMDAELHGEAAPRLHELYRTYPLEFRFGIQLAACLRVLNDEVNLKSLLKDMADRWHTSSEIAKSRLDEITKVTEERQTYWEELKTLEEKETDQEFTRMAKVDSKGKPILFDESEQALIKKLRSIAQGNPESLHFLASTVAAGEGDFEAALEYIERARSTHAHESAFYYHLGNIYISLNRLDEAEASMLEGLSIDESNPKCLMGLSRCYVEMGHYEKALKASQKSIDLQFHFALAHYYCGLAHQRLGNFEPAITALEKAIDQNPNFEEAHTALAEISREFLNNDERAREHQTAANTLAAENLRHKEMATVIDFTPKTREELSEHLPSILDMNNNPEFELALGQAKPTPLTTKHKDEERPQVILVSGLPRSGTSMMMQMLAAAGLPICTDGERIPDENNPKGYYEVNQAKALPTHNIWLHDCGGQVVKVVAPLIRFLPQAVDYKVIYMQRPISEIIRSQSRMLERLGQKMTDLNDEQMGKVMHDDVHTSVSLLSIHKNPILPLSYADVISNPQEAAAAINEFLDVQLDERAMAQAVDPSLYREKSSCDSGSDKP